MCALAAGAVRGSPRLPRVSDPPNPPPLSLLRERSAEAVRAVRDGRSLNDVLAELDSLEAQAAVEVQHG